MGGTTPRSAAPVRTAGGFAPPRGVRSVAGRSSSARRGPEPRTPRRRTLTGGDGSGLVCGEPSSPARSPRWGLGSPWRPPSGESREPLGSGVRHPLHRRRPVALAVAPVAAPRATAVVRRRPTRRGRRLTPPGGSRDLRTEKGARQRCEMDIEPFDAEHHSFDAKHPPPERDHGPAAALGSELTRD